jgi:hypothetical protein
MVNNGKCSIPAASGPVPGKHRVIVVDMGKVAPGPTVDDREEIDKGIVLQIQGGNDEFALEF